MGKLGLAGAILLGSCSAAMAQNWRLAISEMYATPSGWTVGKNASGGCLAAASYRDGTSVWLGFAPDGSTVLAMTNAAWKSVGIGNEYSIQFRMPRSRWTGSFSGFERSGERGLIAIGLKSEFLAQIAGAGGIAVDYQGNEITRLSLNGSRAALNAVVSCQRAFAQAETPQKPRESSPPKSQDKASYGTGFFVSSEGHVLTNEHVVSGCRREFYVAMPGQPRTPASLIAGDARNDLALLKTSMKPPQVATFNIQTKLGEPVYAYGFPQPGLLASTGNFTIGNVTATAGLKDDTSHLQISAPVHGGNSGGPLKDKHGNVLGVIVARMVGDFQTVNFAIKSYIAVNFLQSNNIAADVKSADVPLEPTEIVDRAKRFTVQVMCQ